MGNPESSHRSNDNVYSDSAMIWDSAGVKREISQ